MSDGTTMSVSQVKAAVASIQDIDTLTQALDAENTGAGRKGAVKAISDRIAAVERAASLAEQMQAEANTDAEEPTEEPTAEPTAAQVAFDAARKAAKERGKAAKKNGGMNRAEKRAAQVDDFAAALKGVIGRKRDVVVPVADLPAVLPASASTTSWYWNERPTTVEGACVALNAYAVLGKDGVRIVRNELTEALAEARREVARLEAEVAASLKG